MTTFAPHSIFRPGTRAALSGAVVAITDADLRASADAYDPALHEAPYVVGHPAQDAPAYGFVRRLAFADGELQVTEDAQVLTEFAEWVRDGRYKKRSASFYPPNHPNNPKPGVYYLKHVGFLGAAAPAVKGLKDIHFSDDANSLVLVEFSDHSTPLEEIVEPQQTPSKSQGNPSPSPPTTDFAERERTLAQREQELAERDRKLADDMAAHARQVAQDKALAFADKLADEGKIAPGAAPGWAEVLVQLDAAGTVSFGEGDAKYEGSPADWLRDQLKRLPVTIDYAERSREDQPPDGSPTVQRTQGAEGYSVDPERDRLHRQALEYADRHKVEYLEAVSAVEAGRR